MNISQLIADWHAKASREDHFAAFVFEYLAFIAFLKKKKFIGFPKDRDAIQRLKQDTNIGALYLQKIDNSLELKELWEKLVAELNSVPLGRVLDNSYDTEELNWWNCSYAGLNQQTDEDAQKRKGIVQNLKDWENMVEFWYSIRNNLFHGGKDSGDERDQLLVEIGYKTLKPLVDIFLSSVSG